MKNTVKRVSGVAKQGASNVAFSHFAGIELLFSVCAEFQIRVGDWLQPLEATKFSLKQPNFPRFCVVLGEGGQTTKEAVLIFGIYFRPQV